MGSKSKTKRRTRDDAHPAAPTSSEGSPLFRGVEEVALALAKAARDTLAGDRGAAEDAAFGAVSHPSITLPRRAQRIMVDLIDDLLVQHLWPKGWQPRDLSELTAPRLTKEHVGVLDAVTAHAMRPFATSKVDPRWLGQLAEAPAWSAESNALEAWQRAVRVDAVWSITLAVELLAVLLGTRSLEKLMALPGAWSEVELRPTTEVDQRMLSRVRALLAKAEATDYDEEAEALSAKAQELMTRHSLDRLLVEADAEEGPLPGAVRIWLETPYVQAKAILVNVVAKANRAEAVWDQELGFMTVVGDARDLAATEIMVTSLLVQASRAMVHASTASRDKRAFRQSFLVAYANRIGERLDGAGVQVTAEIGTALVPVLAKHLERVEAARTQLFPSLKARTVTVRSGEGYAAGQAAADRADLGIPNRIA